MLGERCFKSLVLYDEFLFLVDFRMSIFMLYLFYKNKGFNRNKVVEVFVVRFRELC